MVTVEEKFNVTTVFQIFIGLGKQFAGLIYLPLLYLEYGKIIS